MSGTQRDPWAWIRVTGTAPVFAFFALLALGIPIAVVSHSPLGIWLVVAIIAVIPISLMLHAFSRCPHCRRPFFSTQGKRDLWSKVCLNCGTEIYSPVKLESKPS